MAQTASAQNGPNVLEVTAGNPEYVAISARMLNEVITPYSNPRLITFLPEGTTASIEEDGHSLYISPGDEEFVQVIIKDSEQSGAPGLNITFMPQEDIRAQTIILKAVVDESTGAMQTRNEELVTNDYVDLLRELMRDAVREVLPSGFTKDAQWNGYRIQVGPIIGDPQKRAIGTDFAIEYYRLTNTSATTVELVEPNFKDEGVRAVAFIDYVVLAPGQTTGMVWVRER